MLAERFLKYVNKTETCWLWTGGKTGKGYGKCWHEKRILGAHVVSHKLFKGEIPEGLIVRHICNVKACVNPEHLIVGSYKDNLEDARAANGRIGRFPTIPEETVIRVYLLRQMGKQMNEIANELNLITGTVQALASGSIQRNLFEKYESEFGKIPQFNSGHKLTNADRAEIVRLYHERKLSSEEIAARYNTNYKYVWKLANMATKKDLYA